MQGNVFAYIGYSYSLLNLKLFTCLGKGFREPPPNRPP